MAVLYYIHDPMCSWCWGFRNTWLQVQQRLPKGLKTEYLLGGLAADTDQPMPQPMQANIQDTWRHIQQEIPGTRFNYDFWQECVPRRSTWPSCRAVIAARNQDPGKEQAMLLAIQRAYYLEARNPSDEETLVNLAASLELDTGLFRNQLNDPETRAILEQEMKLARQLGAQGFPSLVLKSTGKVHNITIDYNDPDKILDQLNKMI
jgi:putative protein-disulfide isomerase